MHFFGQFGFDFQLDGIAQFHAAFGKKFDAVIGIHIVRSRNHHPGSQTQRAGEIGHARRGQRAGLNHVDAGCGKTRHQRSFEHIT